MKINSRLTNVIVAILLIAQIYELSTRELSLKPDVENEDFNQNYVAGSTTADHDQSPFLQNRGNNDPKGGAECLDLDLQGSMDTIISDHEQIFILMPPKAAGSTMKHFTKRCTKRNLMDNIVFNGGGMENLLTDSVEVPSIISSHVLNDRHLIDTAKHSSSGTLLIYIHRDETDRLVSAIHHVLVTRMCTLGQYNQHNEIMMKNETHCILNEDLIVQHIIKQRKDELKNDVLSCKAYEGLEQHDPNLIFIHYKQVNKLQKLLTKNHCPELLNEPPIEFNFGKDKENGEMQVHIKRKNENSMVTLADWLKEKKHLLEWSLKLRQNDNCQGKTKHMQTDLFNCADETLRVIDGSSLYKQW